MGMASDFERPTSPKYSPEGGINKAAFNDGFPLLIATEASLADLNTRLQQPLPMNRFRYTTILPYLPQYLDPSLSPTHHLSICAPILPTHPPSMMQSSTIKSCSPTSGWGTIESSSLTPP